MIRPRDTASGLPVDTVALPCVVFLGTFVLYGLGLTSSALWDNDETVYAQIAREIVDTGDWITLHWRGVPWFCHPPLVFWLIALLSYPLGMAELAARLPAVFFGASCVAMTCVLGQMLCSRRAGLLAALVLGLNFQFFLHGRMATLDTAILFFLLVSFYGFWRGYLGHRRGWYVMFVGSGLACLAKGPFGLVFPWMVILPFLALTRDLARLRDVPWLGGGLLATTIGLGWYAVELLRHGRAFWDEAFVHYTFARLTTRVMDQGGPWWLYVPVFLLGLFPWSVFAPQAFASLWTTARSPSAPGPQRHACLLLVVWVVVPFVFFSAVVTKLPNYILFAYPAAALAIGRFIDRAITEDPGRLRVGLVLAALTGAGLVAVLRLWAEPRFPQYSLETWRIAGTACGVFVAGAAAAVLWGWRSVPRLAVAFLAAGVAGFLLVCALVLAPAVEQYRPMKRLAATVRQVWQSGDRLAIYGVQGEYSLIFYSGQQVIPIQTEEEFRRLFEGPTRWHVVTSLEAFSRLSRPADVVLIEAAGGVVLVGRRGR